MVDVQWPVVATSRGRVGGVAEGTVVAFRGIPYAASPVGALRFAAPRPHPGWSGVRDATAPGPSVPQPASRLEAVMGPRVPDWNEDGCLTLNVWTPAETLPPGAEPRPVLVWWHGGGFSSGSSGWDWYDGARLAALGGIVVITANYRLGPLGYLHLPEIGAVNPGVRDQIAVLRWVRENIVAFGGDHDAVTVGGQSAGAHSATALAPETRDLVRRMIAQSGPGNIGAQEVAEADDCAAAYLRFLGVTRPEALRGLPVERLLAAYGQLAAERARPGGTAPPMYPVLGGPGMPRPPLQAIADGALGDKDVLLGTTEDEMTAFCAFDPAVRTLTRDDVQTLFTARAEDYGRYAARRPGAAPVRLLADLLTDESFAAPAAGTAAHRAAQGTPAYLYRFTRRPPDDPHDLGACHCADLPFLFGTFDAYPDAPMLGGVDGHDHALAQAFGGALTAFTATGSPNGEGLATWRPYTPDPGTDIMYFGPPFFDPK
ncbi:carboxylesterase/lipase family protein [Streptomyces sp. AV19]|uniref:carboxylesterase/lipase family protein n=1 Tax=Streptomyces sp. AV19 TaxID=2793068 RepID=UPI0018FF016A|nr:carboxylesterase family protein [Streptomyces sp. AV19]MBH1938054.1 carboxylesterase/lipase family protein [Streptomyces sp. AV19]MDG4536668.1 carboxylesterase family protein [Streptomyces sp. AV19]